VLLVRVKAFYHDVLQEVRAMPGVTAAGFASFLPMSSFRGGIWPVLVKGDANASSEIRGANNSAGLRYVTPGFFEAMGHASHAVGTLPPPTRATVRSWRW
jgi:hypothetical protein